MEDLLEKLKRKIKFDIEIHKNVSDYNDMLEDLLNDAVSIGLSLKYPFDETKTELPSRLNNWLLRCCVELYKMADNNDIKSYSENGLSWERFKSGLSNDLIAEIIPEIGIPKEEADNSDD